MAWLNSFILLVFTVFYVDSSSEIDEFNETVNNLRCEFNPDDYLNIAQIIRRHGYPSEAHTVVTSDGYILTLFRIPGSRNGKTGGQPVLLQHGLSGDAATWVLSDNKSLVLSWQAGLNKSWNNFIETEIWQVDNERQNVAWQWAVPAVKRQRIF